MIVSIQKKENLLLYWLYLLSLTWFYTRFKLYSIGLSCNNIQSSLYKCYMLGIAKNNIYI